MIAVNWLIAFSLIFEYNKTWQDPLARMSIFSKRVYLEITRILNLENI